MMTELHSRQTQLLLLSETPQGRVALRRLFGAALGMAERGHPPFTRYPEMVRVILEKEFPRVDPSTAEPK